MIWSPSKRFSNATQTTAAAEKKEIISHVANVDTLFYLFYILHSVQLVFLLNVLHFVPKTIPLRPQTRHIAANTVDSISIFLTPAS